MDNSSYYLSSHTFFCLADNHYVFLDLRGDEYLCLGRTETNLIKPVLKGNNQAGAHWSANHSHSNTDSGATTVVETLLQRELLVQDVKNSKPLTPVCVDSPTTSLIQDSYGLRPSIRTMHALHFLAASATASKNLRWDSIERTVRQVEARKMAHATCSEAIDYAEFSRLFGAFQALRHYYPRPYLCLFDSLSLIHFLAFYGLFPLWIYGVKMEPFHAHCWVQAGTLLVNDVVDNVRDYTPIMCV